MSVNQEKHNEITYDPITFSVILSRCDAVVKEMTLALENSAWTTILALSHDYSCGLYNSKLQQVSMFDALPIHAASMDLVLHSIEKGFEEDIFAGDIFMCNDPASGNTHVGDLVVTAPLFCDKNIAFWVIIRAHQQDVGAPIPSSCFPGAKNVYQEGITIPPMKICEKGIIRKDFMRMYLSNVRYKDMLEGDLLAMMGSICKGIFRLNELIDEYGIKIVEYYVNEIIEYGNRRMSEEMKTIPDGTYYGEGWIDNDGFSVKNIPIKVKVTIKGDSAVVDYTGSAPQLDSGSNGSLATSIAAGTVPFLTYIDPDIPHNEGCSRHVKVIAEEGSICRAKWPASTSTGTTVPSDVMQDVVNKAMATVIPDRVAAGATRNCNTPIVSGVVDGKEWALTMINGGGGGGAAKDTDGWPLYYNEAALGAMKKLSIEQMELLYPLRVENSEIEPESMGMGQWIGGPGIRFVVRPLNGDMLVINCGDGFDNPPFGIMGGTPGIGGGQYVEDLKTGKRIYSSASGTMTVREDQQWVGVSTGGGGFGKPCNRDENKVRENVRDGIISRKTAFEVFGVSLSDGIDPVIRREETDKQRNILRTMKYELVQPTKPASGKWIMEDMREQDEYMLNPTE